MQIKKFDGAGAYMMHDLGPQRFNHLPKQVLAWGQTALAARVLKTMAEVGLDVRDAHLHEGEDGATLHTDAGAIDLHDGNSAAAGQGLDDLLALVAAGVAQERMARLNGWRPGAELPLWAVTASDVLVQRLRANGTSAAALWNAGVNIAEDGWIDRGPIPADPNAHPHRDPRAALPVGSYVARYGTGMHMSWSEGEIEYDEAISGATLELPTDMLSVTGADARGKTLGEALRGDGPLGRALAGYEILDAKAIPPRADALEPQPHRTLLTLAVQMRTLKDIPEQVLDRAGVVDVPTNVERDRPLWTLTPAEALLKYRPRLR